jgi:hypothetical protein
MAAIYLPMPEAYQAPQASRPLDDELWGVAPLKPPRRKQKGKSKPNVKAKVKLPQPEKVKLVIDDRGVDDERWCSSCTARRCSVGEMTCSRAACRRALER